MRPKQPREDRSFERCRGGQTGIREVGDHASATNALEKIQAWFPESDFNERSSLLAGHTFARQQKPAEARAVLEKFAERWPNSTSSH